MSFRTTPRQTLDVDPSSAFGNSPVSTTTTSHRACSILGHAAVLLSPRCLVSNGKESICLQATPDGIHSINTDIAMLTVLYLMTNAVQTSYSVLLYMRLTPRLMFGGALAADIP